MKMQTGKYGEEFVFECSGRTLMPTYGMISINPSRHAGTQSDLWLTDPGHSEKLANEVTADERRELADYMIALWGDYKHSIR